MSELTGTIQRYLGRLLADHKLPILAAVLVSWTLFSIYFSHYLITFGVSIPGWLTYGLVIALAVIDNRIARVTMAMLLIPMLVAAI